MLRVYTATSLLTGASAAFIANGVGLPLPAALALGVGSANLAVVAIASMRVHVSARRSTYTNARSTPYPMSSASEETASLEAVVD